MTLPLRRIAQYSAAALVLLLVLVLVAPLLRVDGFASDIQAALEQALGRKVEVGAVHLSSFPSPGFSVSNVIIHEHPDFGLEPFAYVSSLEVTPRFRSLWRQKLEVASIRLVDPSINLVKNAQGSWNFERLLHRGGGVPQASSAGTLPAISVRRGRINFKFSDAKAVFYLSGSDLELEPPVEGSETVYIRYSGSLARSDRPGRTLGEWRARGSWQASTKQENQLDLDLTMEESSLNELISLVYGRGIGIQGRVAAEIRISGPLSALAISGRAKVPELYRWDVMPVRDSGWAADIDGLLNLTAQELRLGTKAPEGQELPLNLRLRVARYLTEPVFGATASLENFPADPLLDVARQLGAPIAEDVQLTGAVDGAVGYSTAHGFGGRIAIRDASLRVGGLPPFASESAMLDFDQNHVRLRPSALVNARQETATVEGEYNFTNSTTTVTVNSAGLSVHETGEKSQGWIQGMEVPLLAALQSGKWAGALRYTRKGDEPGLWRGSLHLSGASLATHGLADPLEIESARAELDGAAFQIRDARARTGKLPFTGSYRYRPAARRPHSWSLQLPATSGREIEALFAPLLARRKSFLARTFGIGKTPMPEFIHRIHGDGLVEIRSLSVGGLSFENLRTQVYWNGPDLEISEIRASVAEGTLRGKVALDLREALPAYRVSWQLAGARWKQGVWSGEGDLVTSGSGDELIKRMRGHGFVRARSVTFGAAREYTGIDACYELAPEAPNTTRAEFTCLEIQDGAGTPGPYFGSGQMQSDGRLRLELSNGVRELRITGTWSKPESDLTAAKVVERQPPAPDR
jgi:hypothetical protein